MRPLMFFTLLVLGCSPSAPPSIPTPAAEPPATAAAIPVAAREQPVVVEGERDGSSRPFILRGGDYTSRWEARSLTGGLCFHIASLRPTRPNKEFIAATLGTGRIPDAAPQTGETQIYNVPPGEYYVSSSSACGWTITLSSFR